LDSNKIETLDPPMRSSTGACGVNATPSESTVSAGAVEAPTPTIYTDTVAELVAIGAAIAANCEPCFKYHFQQAGKLGVSRADMMRAVKTAQSVKEAPAMAMLQLAQRYLEGDPTGLPTVKSCCG
jgi:AhpD family alkylhydroperoxidase